MGTEGDRRGMEGVHVFFFFFPFSKTSRKARQSKSPPHLPIASRTIPQSESLELFSGSRPRPQGRYV